MGGLITALIARWKFTSGAGHVYVDTTSSGTLPVNEVGNSYVHITTSGVTDVKATAGTLVAVIPNDSHGIITIYDDTTGGTTTPVAVIDTATAANPAVPRVYNISMTSGIQVNAASNDDITIVYR